MIIETCYLIKTESRAKPKSNVENHQIASRDDERKNNDANVDDINCMLKKGKCMNIHVLTGSKDKPLICTKMLVDSGNSGRSLNLKLHACKYSIRTAQGGKVNILGKTNPLRFAMQNCSHIFRWPFLVAREATI